MCLLSFGNMLTELNSIGFIAIADLDTENGSFHDEDTGVFHQGFCRDQLVNIISLTKFRNIKIETASTFRKVHGDYSLFLLTAYK